MTTELQPTIIGIDVSKNKLDIYDGASKKNIVIKNNARAIGQWLSQLTKQHPQNKFVFEPTGGYEKKLINILLANHQEAYYLHPNKLYNYKKCYGDKAKTDKIDSQFITFYSSQHADQLTKVDEKHVENKRLK